MVGRPLTLAAPKSVKLYLGVFVRFITERGCSFAITSSELPLWRLVQSSLLFLSCGVVVLGAPFRSEGGWRCDQRQRSQNVALGRPKAKPCYA
jgi:hypothetical protein